MSLNKYKYLGSRPQNVTVGIDICPHNAVNTNIHHSAKTHTNMHTQCAQCTVSTHSNIMLYWSRQVESEMVRDEQKQVSAPLM